MQSAVDSLTPADVQSATWRRLTKLLEVRRQELREMNDQLGLDPAKTEAIRGRIAEVKRTLDLAAEASLSEDGGPTQEWVVPLPVGDSRPATHQ